MALEWIDGPMDEQMIRMGQREEERKMKRERKKEGGQYPFFFSVRVSVRIKLTDL